ncbi:MAG: metallophosphoesterase family protein [Promethearchaeota archaeon]
MKLVNIKKIAVIADIHANKYALTTFINYIESELKVDYILNLGDFLQIGPHPKVITEVILSDDRFINILGNNEIVITEKANIETREEELKHRKWIENLLNSDLLEKVRNLPTSRNLEINNMKLFMVHSRKIDNQFQNTWKLPLLYQGKSLDDFIKDYPDKAEIILFGHTHEQLFLNRKNKIFVNPGSL